MNAMHKENVHWHISPPVVGPRTGKTGGEKQYLQEKHSPASPAARWG